MSKCAIKMIILKELNECSSFHYWNVLGSIKKKEMCLLVDCACRIMSRLIGGFSSSVSICLVSVVSSRLLILSIYIFLPKVVESWGQSFCKQRGTNDSVWMLTKIFRVFAEWARMCLQSLERASTATLQERCFRKIAKKDCNQVTRRMFTSLFLY